MATDCISHEALVSYYFYLMGEESCLGSGRWGYFLKFPQAGGLDSTQTELSRACLRWGLSLIQAQGVVGTCYSVSLGVRTDGRQEEEYLSVM